MTRRAWLLGGGTALGAVQVHTLKRLRDQHGLPDAIYGTSIGSVNGIAAMIDDLDALEARWRSIRGSSDFQSLAWMAPPYPVHRILPWPAPAGVYHFGPLYAHLLKDIADRAPVTKAYACAVALDTKQYHRLPLHDADAETRARAVIASCSQVPIHASPLINGSPMADGGVHHVIPRCEGEWDEIWAVSCSPVSSAGNEVAPEGVGPMRSLEVAIDRHERSDLIWLYWMAARGTRVWLVEPSVRPGEPFDASAETIKWRLDVAGPAAWDNRRLLQRMAASDLMRSLLG